MATQIVSINPLQAGKFFAVMYFIIGVVFIPFALVGAIGNPDNAMPFGLLIIFPFLYAVLAFVFVPLFCWLYNKIAERLGGIEVTLRETDVDAAAE